MQDEMLGSKKARWLKVPAEIDNNLFILGELGDDREIGPDGV